MVERRKAGGFEKIINQNRLMTAMMVLPLLYPWQIARFSRQNKASNHIVKNCELQSFFRNLEPESNTY